MVYLVALAEPIIIPIHPFCQAQVALLISEKSRIYIEYFDLSNVFFSDSAAEPLEHNGINHHLIHLLDDKKPLYGPIYSLGLVELEILKTYIEANLASCFIRPFKSPAGAPILFVQKKDGSLRLCVDYREFNNLTIKNCYLLLLISNSLNCLGCAQRFTWLDLTNSYYLMRIWKDDRWKTGFWMQYSHFKYQVMPFGLSSTPASFEGYVNKIPAEILNVFIIVYLDNILIYTKNAGQGHVKVVW